MPYARRITSAATTRATKASRPAPTDRIRQTPEVSVLTIPSERLMYPELVELFVARHIDERNLLDAIHTDDRAVKEKELPRAIERQDKMMNSLRKS